MSQAWIFVSTYHVGTIVATVMEAGDEWRGEYCFECKREHECEYERKGEPQRHIACESCSDLADADFTLFRH